MVCAVQRHVATQRLEVFLYRFGIRGTTLFEKRCIAEVMCSSSYKDIGSAAEGHGQLPGQGIIAIASLKAKLLPAFSKLNYRDAAEERGIETPYLWS